MKKEEEEEEEDHLRAGPLALCHKLDPPLVIALRS